MTISILTIFPDMVREIMSYGVIGQAAKKRILEINPVDLRDFATDKHRSVDDKPFGGGPGMVMRVDIVDRALRALEAESGKSSTLRISDPNGRKAESKRIVLMSASGPQFTQQRAEQYAKLDHLILISGRYEGVDERVREHLVDEELSIGPYVLSGGEIPAMAVTDAVARLVPGVLGDPESLVNESFSTSGKREVFDPEGLRPEWAESGKEETTMDFPQYTQPAEYRGWTVPDVLRSGNHEEIKKWREERRKKLVIGD